MVKLQPALLPARFSPPRLRSERGAALVWATSLIVILIGFASLSVDMGMLYTRKQALQNGVDAAVVAGATKLPNTSLAISTAQKVAQENGIALNQVNVYTCGPTVHASATEKVNLAFAKIFNKNTSNVKAAAVANQRAVNIVDHSIRPFGVDDKFVPKLKPGVEANLKQVCGCYETPSMQSLDLSGGTGKSFYAIISNGADIPLKVGDNVTVATGNMVGPTDQGVADLLTRASQPPWNKQAWNTLTSDNPRIVSLPVVHYDNLPAKSGTVKGFLSFYVTSSTGGNIKGIFLNDVALPGAVNDPGVPMAYDDPNGSGRGVWWTNPISSMKTSHLTE